MSSAQDHLTHLDPSGAARMVDVSAKDVTARTARASGRVRVAPRVVELLRG
ncbi:cyclic pyranopterin monophosphate synthase MoaC, partial [Streptomyces sp. 8ZJF_21]|nr:cyclic pyranopterin monophosphate synthase MoaC [Streptomyces sp. 8ZJF_21]